MGQINNLKRARDQKLVDIYAKQVTLKHNLLTLKEKSEDGMRHPITPLLGFIAGWVYGGRRSKGKEQRKGNKVNPRDYLWKLVVPLAVSEFKRQRKE